MPAKKKAKKVSKEEQDRINREREEILKQEQLVLRERQAEKRQEKSNERRDLAEENEQQRAKKEEQIRLMSLKDIRISVLSNDIEKQKTLFLAERAELEAELSRLATMRELLLNEISTIKAQHEETEKRLLVERENLCTSYESLKHEYHRFKSQATDMDTQKNSELKILQASHETLSKLNERLKDEKDQNEREMIMRIKQLEREVEKVSALNTTLQTVLDDREADDRKNVTLMQMLNNQLDESKQKTEELVREEKEVSNRLKAQVITLQSEVEKLTERNTVLKKEKDSLELKMEGDLQDYHSKIEQMKFDLKYLHSELHSFKNQAQKNEEELVNIKAASQSESLTSNLEKETFAKRVEELESLLRRKDREFFDKSTFLNAQIANNRTIIAQLQEKLKSEREAREEEKSAANAEITAKQESLKNMSTEMDRKRNSASDIQMKLSSDNSILKATVYQLQSSLVEREKEMNSIIAAKDNQIKRLSEKLDENFITHRTGSDYCAVSEVNAAGDSDGKILSKLNRELEVRNKSAEEVEIRLKAQLANQGLIIDNLQTEIASLKSDNQETSQLLMTENEHLREILKQHCIPLSE